MVDSENTNGFADIIKQKIKEQQILIKRELTRKQHTQNKEKHP